MVSKATYTGLWVSIALYSLLKSSARLIFRMVFGQHAQAFGHPLRYTASRSHLLARFVHSHTIIKCMKASLAVESMQILISNTRHQVLDRLNYEDELT